jgi:hypothetical protein
MPLGEVLSPYLAQDEHPFQYKPHDDQILISLMILTQDMRVPAPHMVCVCVCVFVKFELSNISLSWNDCDRLEPMLCSPLVLKKNQRFLVPASFLTCLDLQFLESSFETI